MAAPLTAFEARGKVAPWTSLAEEETFWTNLLAEAPHVTRDQIGTASGGAPMHLVTLGTGPRAVLFVAQQHGSELSGREALLARLRDWATTTDPATLAYLTQFTVLAIPTAHPDNLAARDNTNGINVNRDHLALTQPESRAISAVIRDHKPDLIVDLHEGANIVNDYATSPTMNPTVDPELYALSHQVDDTVRDAIQGAGHTWERYQASRITGPEYFQNAGALHGAVTLLLETRRVYGDDTDAAFRHDLQLIAIDAIREWHGTNQDAIAAAIAEWPARATARTGVVSLPVGTTQVGPEVIIPKGYLVTPEEHDSLAVHRDRFGLASEPRGDGYFLTAAQAGQSALIYLADPTSEVRLVDAVRVAPPAPPGPLVPIGNHALRFRHNGRTYRARLVAKAP